MGNPLRWRINRNSVSEEVVEQLHADRISSIVMVDAGTSSTSSAPSISSTAWREP
jgi:hypothetical protein